VLPSDLLLVLLAGRVPTGTTPPAS
jgi:hypothetical protein